MPSVLDEIRARGKPGDVARWWGQRPPRESTSVLDDEEIGYLEFFTSSEVEPVLRIGRGIATFSNLDDEDKERASRHFGKVPEATALFVNYENRRRIVAHYVVTHPATIQYQFELYRLTRDVIPPLFVAERLYELITGQEAFTGEKISRLGATIELLVPIVLGGALKLAKMRTAVARPPSRPLSDPLYDLPADGGGMRINGRYYTEHALERMAPNTPQIRAELEARAAQRLIRLGITPGSGAWDACLAKALRKIDPRGIPPSVIEAELMRPGSTSVRVISARQRQVVITVMPR
jgi:hypothetical protein